jgi:pimeloyl-ACP methyl ester carboxylesterase
VVFLASQPRLAGSRLLAAELGFGKSHYAPFGTNRVHYVLGGKGSAAVVFIHGWGANVLFWREQVPALKDKARGILVDLPGHGQSDKPKTDYRVIEGAGHCLMQEKPKKFNAVLVGVLEKFDLLK